MTTARQEIEIPSPLEERATREVEEYIEKIEKKTEVSGAVASTQNPSQALTQNANPVFQDMGKQIMAQTQKMGKPKITLPLSQEEVRAGLSARVAEGVRWLAEWCVFMIKKYPGRVFYPART